MNHEFFYKKEIKMMNLVHCSFLKEKDGKSLLFIKMILFSVCLDKKGMQFYF